MIPIDVIRQALRDNLSHTSEVYLEDVLQEPCTVRSAHRHMGTAPNAPEAPEKILIREFKQGLRRMVRGYLADTFPDDFVRGGTAYHQGVLVDVIGVYKGHLVEVVPVNEVDFKKKIVPRRARIGSVVKAHLTGAGDRDIYIILIDHNTQSWAAFSMIPEEKTRKEVVDVAMQQLDYMGRLINKKTDPIGTASRETCAVCPFSQSCQVPTTEMDPDKYYVKTSFRPFSKLTSDIDDHLWSLNVRDDSRSGAIHPSELSTTRCDRVLGYRLMNVPEHPRVDAGLRRIFDAGNAMHDVLQAALAWGLPSFEEEVPMRIEKEQMSGHCDGVDTEEGYRRGWELKSISTKGYNSVRSAKTEHKKQGAVYTAGLDLEEVVYTYANKSTGEVRCLTVAPDQRIWRKLADRSHSVIQTVKDGKLPPRIDNDYVCKRCVFAWKCKPDIIPGRPKKTFRIRRK